MTRYYIVAVEDEERNLDTRYVGQIRSYPELIHCRDCANHEPDDMIKSLMDMTFYDEEGHTIDDYEDRLEIVKSFVDPVPTVEAIPIEWIEKYVESCPGMFKKDMRWIEIMVVWWKEEQEKENDS